MVRSRERFIASALFFMKIISSCSLFTSRLYFYSSSMVSWLQR